MAVIHDIASFAAYIPLRNPDDHDFGELCSNLWGWIDCAACGNRGTCTSESCQRVKLLSLSTFWKFYRDATYWYTSDSWFESQPLLQSHSELNRLVRFIVEHSETPRECLTADYARQESREQATQATDADKICAFNLAYSVIAMLPCAERNSFHIQFPGLAPVTWIKSQATCQV